jgi:hypothetical protein
MLKTNQSSKRNNGSASKLMGSCHPWSFEEKNRVAENLALATDFIKGNAKKYNINLTTAIPVVVVNVHKRRLVSLPFRKHFRILRASTRHIIRQIDDGWWYNFKQVG